MIKAFNIKLQILITSWCKSSELDYQDLWSAGYNPDQLKEQEQEQETLVALPLLPAEWFYQSEQI